MIKIRRLEESEEAPYLKRARGKEKLHKLKPVEIFHRLPDLSIGSLSTLKDKRLTGIITHLTDYFNSTDFKHTRQNNVEKVVCKVFEALDGRFLNFKIISDFIESVKKTGIFNPHTPISAPLQTVAEKLFIKGNLIALKLAELGRMYNIVGLIQAASSCNDDLFKTLLYRGVDFNFPTIVPYHFAKTVLVNLKHDSILRMLSLPVQLPPESYHYILLNEHLTEIEKLNLIKILAERGLSTRIVYEANEPIQLALEKKYSKISHFLASLPYDPGKTHEYFLLALKNDHAETIDLLTGARDVHCGIDVSKEVVGYFRKAQKSLMVLKGRLKWIIPPFSQIEKLKRFQASPPPLLAELKPLVDNGSLEILKGDLCLTTLSDDLLRTMVLRNPQSIALSYYQDLNPTLYYFLLFKRISHVWSLKIETEHPALNSLIRGEGCNPNSMISLYIQFLHLIQSEIPKPELIFTLNALKDYTVGGQSIAQLLVIKNASQNSPQVLISGYDSHLNVVILYKNFVIYCDRGGISEKKGFRVYEFPPNQSYDPADLNLILDNNKSNRENCFSEKKLVAKWSLNLVSEGILKRQKCGNCTHASIDAAIKALMTLYLKIAMPLIAWGAAFSTIQATYKKITHSYRYYTLNELLQGLDSYKRERKTVKKIDDLFYKLVTNLFLRLQENPHKLGYYTPQGPQLINRLAQILNEF